MPLDQKTLAEIGALALKIRHHKDPAKRRQFVQLVKDVAPNLTFPDVEQEERIEKLISDDRDARQKQRDDDAKAALTRQLSEGRAALADRYNEDQIKEIEQVMLKRGLDNYEDAAILYAHYNPPVRPTTGRPQLRFELPSNKDWLTNPRKMAMDTAYDVIDEIRGKARRTA